MTHKKMLTFILSNKLMIQKQSYTLYKEQNTNLVKENINVSFFWSVMGMSWVVTHLLPQFIACRGTIFFFTGICILSNNRKRSSWLLTVASTLSICCSQVQHSQLEMRTEKFTHLWKHKPTIFQSETYYQCNRDCMLLVRHSTFW